MGTVASSGVEGALASVGLVVVNGAASVVSAGAGTIVGPLRCGTPVPCARTTPQVPSIAVVMSPIATATAFRRRW